MRLVFNGTLLDFDTKSNHKLLKFAFNGIKRWKKGELDTGWLAVLVGKKFYVSVSSELRILNRRITSNILKIISFMDSFMGYTQLLIFYFQ